MSSEKRKRNKYSAEDFYNFGKQKLKASEIATRRGISETAIYNQLAKPDFRRAYDDGKAGRAFQTEAVEPVNIVETLPSVKIPDTKTDIETPEELPYAEIERRILAAIDDHFCTEWGIKNHAGFAPSLDISEILKGMLADRKVRRERDDDVTTAYFRFNWKVKRFWRDGASKGKLGIEFETGDGVFRRDPASLTKTKAEIFKKLREISELVQSL
jgi:hypothetical protein